MKSYIPIGCTDYDYLEITCMDRYEVDVIQDNDTLCGMAVAIESSNTGEYLTIRLDDDTCQSVRLDYIRRIIVRSKHRRFDEWVFGSPAPSY